MFRSEIVLA